MPLFVCLKRLKFTNFIYVSLVSLTITYDLQKTNCCKQSLFSLTGLMFDSMHCDCLTEIIYHATSQLSFLSSFLQQMIVKSSFININMNENNKKHGHNLAKSHKASLTSILGPHSWDSWLTRIES